MNHESALPRAGDDRPLFTFGLLQFAWAVEIFGILLGIANSVSISFPKELPSTISGWLPALPVAVLAAFEVLRIPLAKAFQQTPRIVPRFLSLLAILALVGIAFENWTLGLERTVNQRIAPVELLRDEVRQTQQAMTSQYNVNETARTALQQQVESAGQDLREIEQQIAAEQGRHNQNMDRVKECLKLAIICYQAELDKESRRYDAAKTPLEKRRALVASSREKAKADLLALSTDGDANKMDNLRQAHARALKALDSEVKENPIYRLASAVYGVSPNSLTDKQVATARAFFAMFGAGIVSITATLAALIHYWPKGGTSKLSRALRAYLARLRRKVVRTEIVEVPVEKIVEKIVPEIEKPILIEKTIVRFVPYTGNGSLPEDETSVKRVEGRPAEEALTAARANNASHLRIYK